MANEGLHNAVHQVEKILRSFGSYFYSQREIRRLNRICTAVPARQTARAVTAK